MALLLAILFLPVAFLVHNTYKDYLVFLSLGPGGTPKNISGYCRCRFLSLFALRNPYTTTQIPPTTVPRSNLLDDLPTRTGARPETLGIAPHRQTTQRSSSETFNSLSDQIHSLASLNDTTLILGTSCFEKHGTGLFSPQPCRRTCSGEICHAHPSDGSMHLTLHPADAKAAVEKGWAEMHPLARGGWFEQFVPAGFLMVYAPRDEAEVEVVMRIVRAAAWWVGGCEVCTAEDCNLPCASDGGLKPEKGPWATSVEVKDVRRDSGIEVDSPEAQRVEE